MEQFSPPKISASISLEQPTDSSANSPGELNLNLTLTLHNQTAITIYADDTSPKLMMIYGAFNIIDLMTGNYVRQRKRTRCRIPPPTKVAVPLNESLFLTLLPETPITLSAPFMRSPISTGAKALPKDDRGYCSETSVTYDASRGVDGLEPGHKYALSLASDSRIFWYVVRWWEYGVKEQVLHGSGGDGGLDGRRVKFDPGPHPAIVIDTAGIGVVEFERCE